MRLNHSSFVVLFFVSACGGGESGNHEPGNEPTLSAESLATATSTISVNFQPEGAPVPSGFHSDVGSVYGDRGGGWSYGWNADNSGNTRWRHSSLSPDVQHDTLARMQGWGNPNAAWEIGVPNGDYAIRLVAGDPSLYSSQLEIDVEGQRVIDGATSSSKPWFDQRATVTVTDGKLTLSNASGARNNKVCFIEIAQVAPAAPVAPTSTCGDGTCGSGETSTSCPSDCPAATVTPTSTCGDGMCDSAETTTSCPSDCPMAPMPMPSSTSTSPMPMPSPDTYPIGSSGTSEYRIQPTTEQPAPSDIGAFRTVCAYSHMSTDDPIVFPGQPGKAHLHMFFGNTGANAYSTYDSLRQSGNSTCRGGIANRTAYWAPALIGPNGPMAPGDSNFYYKAGYSIPNVSPRIQRIPEGLRMIAGNAKSTGPQDTFIASWGCLNVYRGHNTQIIDCDVGDYIEARVIFPQCWNGKDLDSADHKSHMAYPVDGACPSTHPVILPEISLNLVWLRTPDMDVSKLRLSSDMYGTDLPGGYSLHSDWFGGWDPAISDAFVANCIDKTLDCHSHLVGDGREMY